MKFVIGRVISAALVIKMRFDDEMIELLLGFKWWDKSIEEINSLIPLLTCSDIEKVRAEIMKRSE